MMSGNGVPTASSSLRWADELDNMDSDIDGLDLPSVNASSSHDPKASLSEFAHGRSIDTPKESAFHVSRERSFGGSPGEYGSSYDSDRMRTQRVIDSDRTDFFSRDNRDSMNRRAPRNSKKTGNRRSKSDQPKVDDSSWRCSSNSSGSNNRLCSFNSKNEG